MLSLPEAVAEATLQIRKGGPSLVMIAPACAIHRIAILTKPGRQVKLRVET
jgi:hypothetical protein